MNKNDNELQQFKNNVMEFLKARHNKGKNGNDESTSRFWLRVKDSMNDKNNVFYQKIDLGNIGITGHSQGGAGVFTSITIMEHKDDYKTAVALSPTMEETAIALGWNYDLSKINIPTLMIAGTKGDFEIKIVIPIEKMIDMYNKIPSQKVMMRRTGADHGQMLYAADGYVTAWFMWQLQGDEEAAKAFVGDSPEIMNNSLYQDQRIDIK